MIKVDSKALNKSLQIERIIGHVKGSLPGPTLIFFAGIHGNEPSGVFALRQVIEWLEAENLTVCGNLYAISGNLPALEKGVRLIDHDLNRIWTEDNVTPAFEPTTTSPIKSSVEHQELVEIINELRGIKSGNTGPYYFFDLHSTSSETIPHILINDTLLNRKFALKFPLPIILGIEEYLSGPLLSYINLYGYISLGFESGQHDSQDAIDNHVCFIHEALGITGFVEWSKVKSKCQFSLNGIQPNNNIFEIIYRHEIKPEEKFKMKNGFVNFQTIHKGEELATSNNQHLIAKHHGHIFMPLYQSLSNDGYFIIKKIPYLFLKVSSLVRKIKLDTILTLLPGVRWADDGKKHLYINQHVAKFFAKDFLHLMGYRVKEKGGHHLVASKREDSQENERYKHEVWLKANKPLPGSR